MLFERRLEGAVHPLFASLLYAMTDWSMLTIGKLLATSDVVIADRYNLSNLAYQGLK